MDLTEILKNVPVGTQLYSPIFGEVEFKGIRDDEVSKYCINCTSSINGKDVYFAKDGTIDVNYPGECMLFPSKTNRDWESFAKSLEPECPFKPYDHVLVRDRDKTQWIHEVFGMYVKDATYPYICLCANYRQCIPFEGNEHLLGTTNNPTE